MRLTRVSENISCVQSIGGRAGGKSEGAKQDLFRIALKNGMAVVCTDLPGKLAREMTGSLAANGMKNRTFFDAVRIEGLGMDRVLSWPMMRPLDLTNPLKEEDNRVEVEEILIALWAQGGAKVTEEKPYTRKYCSAAIRLYASQPTLPALWWIQKALEPGTREHDEMMDNARDRDAVRILAQLEHRSQRNPTQYEIEAGAAWRKLDVFKSPSLWARHGQKDPWRQLLLNRAQVYFDLSGVTMVTAKTFTILVANAVIRTCKDYFNETGKQLPVLLVQEECGFLGTATPNLIDGMRGWRKAGFATYLISQSLKDFPIDVREQILALCDTHYYYRLAGALDEAAEDLANQTFDPLAVLTSQKRKQVIGHEEVATASRGKSKDHLGNVREDERQGTSLRPVLEDVTTDTLKTPQLQVQEYKTKLSRLMPPYRWVKDTTGARLETVTMLGEPWKFPEIFRKRFPKLVEEIQRRPQYTAVQSGPQTAHEMMDGGATP